MPAGRPSSYTSERAAEICDLIADGLSLREICRREGMPDKTTVLRWLASREEFRIQYAHARELQADAFAEEILEIADDATNDWMMRQNGDGEPPTKVADHEHISRSKLRVDARKWLMSKMAPKKYGDKLIHAGDADNPMRMSFDDKSPDELRAFIARETATLGIGGAEAAPSGSRRGAGTKPH